MQQYSQLAVPGSNGALWCSARFRVSCSISCCCCASLGTGFYCRYPLAHTGCGGAAHQRAGGEVLAPSATDTSRVPFASPRRTCRSTPRSPCVRHAGVSGPASTTDGARHGRSCACVARHARVEPLCCSAASVCQPQFTCRTPRASDRSAGHVFSRAAAELGAHGAARSSPYKQRRTYASSGASTGQGTCI